MDLPYSKRFINGLKKYDLNIEDFKKQDWKYLGNRYSMQINKCICGHKVTHCYFVRNNNIILPVGSGCLKNFIQNKTKFCIKCNCIHKNRKFNFCNECKNTFSIEKKDINLYFD
jgi:hypothetical protein